MAKVIKNMDEIIISNESTSSDWKMFDINENEAFLEKLNILTPIPKKINGTWVNTIHMQILNKTVLENTRTQELFLFKKNMYNPNPIKNEKELHIPTAINEHIFTHIAHEFNLNSIILTKICNLHLNSNETKICSYNKIEKDYLCLPKMRKYHIEQYNKLMLQLGGIKIPLNYKIFLASIGNVLKTGNIIVNSEGDFKIVDLGDSHPEFVNYCMQVHLFDQLSKHTVEQQYDMLILAQSILQKLLKRCENIHSEFAQIYSKTNLIFNPKTKTNIGFAIYNAVWIELLKSINNKLLTLNKHAEELTLS